MDQILQVLSGNARMDLDKMAVMLDMPAEEIQKKIQEYEQAGVIRGYKPLLDYDKIDTELVEAIIEVALSGISALRRLPGLSANTTRFPVST